MWPGCNFRQWPFDTACRAGGPCCLLQLPTDLLQAKLHMLQASLARNPVAMQALQLHNSAPLLVCHLMQEPLLLHRALKKLELQAKVG